MCLLIYILGGGKEMKLYKEIPVGNKPVKSFIIKTLLFSLGRGFQSLARVDSDLKNEVDNWDDSFSIMFEVLPKGPYMSLQKRNGRLRYLGLKKLDNAELTICFKNIETAFMVFTAQLSTPAAYAQHRLSVKGDLSKSMALIRCLNIVQFYLFPKIIAKNIILRLPKMTPKKFAKRLYAYLIGIPLGV